MNEDRAISLDHHEPRRLGENGLEPARVDDLAAGDDETHGTTTVPAVSDVSEWAEIQADAEARAPA